MIQPTITADTCTSTTMASRAELVLSFDFELAWGAVENGRWREYEQRSVYTELRRALPQLLKLLDGYDLPATWGLVGGLLQPAGKQDLSHLPAPLRDGIGAVMKEAAPASLDGRDLVERIAAARSPHRFCSHTYSHVRFGHPRVDAKVVQGELQRFADCFPRELPWTAALIFPLNEEAFYPELREAGYTTCRGRSVEVARCLPHRLGRCAALCLPPPLSRRTEVVPGLWRETDSLLFNAAGVAWKRALVARRAFWGLRRALRLRGTFHVWTHPGDLAADPALLPLLGQFLERAARYRDQGRLVVRTL